MEFDRQKFEICLQTRQFGRPLYVFNILASTNSTLWDLLDQGAAPGTTVIAIQQEAGRGQWGRQWQSPPGGLYLSLAIASASVNQDNDRSLASTLKLRAEQSGQLTLCSAWGIAVALRNYAIPIRLKWPNDLLLQGRKLGGILTETRVSHGQITAAVVGVGINWSNPVPEAGISLQGLGPLPIQSLEMLAAVTLAGLEAGYQCWQASGIESLLPDYLKLLTHTSPQVQVEG